MFDSFRAGLPLVLTLVLAGCHLGDPAGSSAGVVSVDGRVAVVVPPCGDEYVQELSVEEDGVDAGGAPRPTSRQLWHVVGMPRDRRGPFVIGDATGWTSERVPLTEPLPAIFVVSVTTTRRIAASGVSASAVAGLADGQVLIDSNVSSLAALSEQWEC